MFSQPGQVEVGGEMTHVRMAPSGGLSVVVQQLRGMKEWSDLVE